MKSDVSEQAIGSNVITTFMGLESFKYIVKIVHVTTMVQP